MQLVGMLDSPYVRRVAVSLQLLGIPFTHLSISVFRAMDRMREINPVIKVPTLVCDDGTVLMDSSLILDLAETMTAGRRSLMPSMLPERQHALRLIGLGLAANEKSVAIYYEGTTRPPEKAHQPWVDRLTAQLRAAYDAIEAEITRTPLAPTSQAGVTVATAWFFTQALLPEVVDAAKYPALTALSKQAEALPEFKAAAHGDGTCPITA